MTVCSCGGALDGASWCCLKCDRERSRVRRADPAYQERTRVVALARRANNLEISRAKERAVSRAKQEWVNTLKASPCSDCGGSFDACVMDFDHIRGVKFKGIGQMVTYSKERILAELSKCDLVCANCHRTRTAVRRSAVTNSHRRRYYAKIDALKGSPCVDCDRLFPPEAMDFDHVSGVKVASIAQMRSQAWGRVLIELAKCELVCANCHRIRTSQRREAA